MLAEDLKLEEEKLKAMSLDKASSIIDLGKRPMTDELRVNLLGPKLKRRFVGDSAPINRSQCMDHMDALECSRCLCVRLEKKGLKTPNVK